MTKSRIFLIRGYPAFLKNCFPFFTGYVHVLRIHATLLYEKKVGMTDLLYEKALTIKGIPGCIELCLRNACALHRNMQQTI